MKIHDIKWYIILFILSCSVIYNPVHAKSKILYGYSSWYGDKFHGRKTASGEIYNMHKLTAAHRTLPFGTYLKVTNISNKKQVIVKVNDRGPFKANRIIDVSREAAKRLGFINQGLARVKIEILDHYNESVEAKETSDNSPEEPIPVDEEQVMKTAVKKRVSPKNKVYSDNEIKTKNNHIYIVNAKKAIKKTKQPIYLIQLGAYSKLEHAVSKTGLLSKKGISAVICIFPQNRKIYRVVYKKTFKNKNDANYSRDTFF